MRYRLHHRDTVLRTGDVNEYAAMRQLIEEGYEVYKRGWPDFAAVKGDQIRFIEMKGPHGHVKSHQAKIADILRRAGCSVEVWKKENGRG